VTHALRLLLGDIATHPDRFGAERGETYYREALTLAELQGMRPLIAHCHFGLGKSYRRTGKRVQLHEHLTTATTMYREMDMHFWLEQAERDEGYGTRTKGSRSRRRCDSITHCVALTLSADCPGGPRGTL